MKNSNRPSSSLSDKGMARKLACPMHRDFLPMCPVRWWKVVFAFYTCLQFITFFTLQNAGHTTQIWVTSECTVSKYVRGAESYKLDNAMLEAFSFFLLSSKSNSLNLEINCCLFLYVLMRVSQIWGVGTAGGPGTLLTKIPADAQIWQIWHDNLQQLSSSRLKNSGFLAEIRSSQTKAYHPKPP